MTNEAFQALVLDSLKALQSDVQSLSAGQQRFSIDVQNLKDGQQRLSSDVQNLKDGQQRLSDAVQCLKAGQQRLEDKLDVIHAEVKTSFDTVYQALGELQGDLEEVANDTQYVAMHKLTDKRMQLRDKLLR